MNDINPEKFLNNPTEFFILWLSEAKKTEINDPEAMALATVDSNGYPSVRIVLLKEASEQGFKFHTNENSEKGLAIAENPNVELCFYWKSIRKQVRVRGRAAPVGDAESDEYFATRPRARQIGAWASQQSRPLDSPADLERAIQEYEEKFKDQDVPRPLHWKGYRVVPDRMEFWIGHEHRLHTRFVYHREKDGWAWEWLNP